MRSRLAPLFENVVESTAACLVTMVQGNLWLLSATHWGVASRTGLVAGALAWVAVMLARAERRWMVSLALGVATAAVDYGMHPGGFGPVWAEAVVTGLGAAALSYGVGTLLGRLRSR